MLFYVICFGYKCFVKELIEKGCDLNEVDVESYYFLYEVVD